MGNKQIATYLNDHLAGSVAALELLENLEAAHAGMPLARFLVELREDITADRQELEALMSRLHVAQSRTRKATAWAVEKLSGLKLRLDDPAGGALRLLQALEAAALGIEGKEALWCALRAVAAEATELQGVDYDRLVKRAEEQRRRVEEVRLEAAKKALLLTTP
jgi:hypothetical protein